MNLNQFWKLTWKAIASGLCGLLLVASTTTAQTTKTKQIGSFMVATVTDQMTDAKLTTIMSAGSNNELALGWSCRGDGALVVVLKAQGSNLIREVQHRFGKLPPVTSKWEQGVTGGGTVTLAGEAAETFTKEARQYPSIVLRIYNGESVTDTIPLRNLGLALQELPCRAKK